MAEENDFIYICSGCGCDDVEEKAWVKANSNIYVEFCEINEKSDQWCCNCEENTDFVTLEKGNNMEDYESTENDKGFRIWKKSNES